MIDTTVDEQKSLCKKFGVDWLESPVTMKVGIAKNIKEGLVPINGLRHPPEGDTTGWYIWAGEEFPSEDPDYFLPLHVAHLKEWCPVVLKYLGLPSGWRFLTDGNYEDVWYDESLLKID